ncbi:MAG: PaaI family thioesterase [Gammaproteobacteria bacterium]|nr:PaaI family thioesterase [Gammaproteobacteria bacterium]
MGDTPPSGRTRTFSWGDPLVTAAAARRLDGLAFLQAIVAGEYPQPPMAATLGFALVEVERGRAVFEVEPQEFHYNPIGTAHGGLAATLLDSALGCAVHSQLAAGVGYTTLEFKVNLTRAITRETGRLRAEGRVIHGGRTTAMADASLRDAAGKLYAHGTTTCLIMQPDA